MLHEFLTNNRAELVLRAQAKVKVRRAPLPTDAELAHGIPLFLDQLVATLRSNPQSDNDDRISVAATAHGADLLKMGFTIAQVVHDYGDVCQAVTELAVETNAPVSTEEFRTLNRCLDDAIAGAVTEYTRLRDIARSDEHTERLGSLAHELRNSVNGAILAHELLKTGRVGTGGSTSAVLERSLKSLGALISRSLADVRLRAGKTSPAPLQVSELLEDIELISSLEANAHNVGFSVAPVTDDIGVYADRPILAAAITNLLQNAFKFSRAGGQVTLVTTATADTVVFEISDECGGLPPGKAAELFKPFMQRSTNRQGLGLGLSISKRGVEADGGALTVRDVPGHGCVFSISLPRHIAGTLPAPKVAA